MTLSTFAALAFAGAAFLLILGATITPRRGRIPLVKSIRIGTNTMTATVGVAKKLTLSPKDVFGLPVDLVKFPTALTDVVWSVSDPSLASINVTKADGTEAELTAGGTGSITVTVNGKNKAGEILGETLSLTIEEDVPLVKTLGLAEA